MAIIFVMGPSCGGKSYFIKENFPNYKKIDLYDFQKKLSQKKEIEHGYEYLSIAEVFQSYKDCENALIDEIKKDTKNIVLEHTLLKEKRRKVYIDAVKSVTNEPIIAYWIVPEPDKLLEYSKKRDINYTYSQIDDLFFIMEEPTLEEGFSEVHIIN